MHVVVCVYLLGATPYGIPVMYIQCVGLAAEPSYGHAMHAAVIQHCIAAFAVKHGIQSGSAATSLEHLAIAVIFDGFTLLMYHCCSHSSQAFSLWCRWLLQNL